LLALSAALSAPASGAPARVDWRTYGFSANRSGLNPYEQTLDSSRARSLRRLWSADLGGGEVDTQPLVASGVRLSTGESADVVYAGTEHGRLVALDARSGAPVWSRDLGAVHVARCHWTYGITDTPVLDRTRGSLYVVAGTGEAYELDLATGATKHRWPITGDPQQEHVWSGLTLVHGILYVPVAGTCDIPPYRGRVLAIDTHTSRQVAVWHVTGHSGVEGGGIWAWGGLSADPQRNALYAATGNSFPPPSEHVGYAEHVVRLGTRLHVRASNYPGVTGGDADFGATPLLYKAKGCPRQLAVGNKFGDFFVYDRDHIQHGPVQHISLGGSGDGGHALLGVAAFWRAKRMVYVANPLPRGRFKRGIVAFHVTGACRLALAWQAKGPGKLTSSPTLADGVLYYGTGTGGKLVAHKATTGRRLWTSGGVVQGAIYNAPAVIAGMVYVGSWDGRLYAFGGGPRRSAPVAGRAR